MSKFAFKKKSHKDLVQLVINKELSPEQVNAIRGGLESGLDEEQLRSVSPVRNAYWAINSFSSIPKSASVSSISFIASVIIIRLITNGQSR